MIKKYIILLSLIVMMSCNTSNKEGYIVKNERPEINNTHPGKKLMEANCNSCHNPTASHDDRLGPPMIAVKKHYIDSETSKEDFINAIKSWIKNPNEEDAKMFGAVRRFGVMPKQSFPEETVELIAEYIYDYDIDQPEWFEEHMNEEMGKNKGKGNGKKKGMRNGMH